MINFGIFFILDFCALFLDMPAANLTVITIAQKAVNDMSAWSLKVEKEREELLENVRFEFEVIFLKFLL